MGDHNTTAPAGRMVLDAAFSIRWVQQKHFIEIECFVDQSSFTFHYNGIFVSWAAPVAGIRSPSALDYDPFYLVAFGNAGHAVGRPSVDGRAVSVAEPLDMAPHRRSSWPSFLLDLLPQGHARRRLAAEMGVDGDDEGFAFPLLMRRAGSPIGNLRVREAWLAEQNRLPGEPVCGVPLEEVFDRASAFRDLADRFALIASGSSGVQGEWPKILLPRAEDGLWYPDLVVADDNARDHVIVKMSRARFPEDQVILACKVSYLEIAREFGFPLGRPLMHRNDTLVIPRFDRAVVGGVTLCLGQESQVATFADRAAAVARPGIRPEAPCRAVSPSPAPLCSMHAMPCIGRSRPDACHGPKGCGRCAKPSA